MRLAHVADTVVGDETAQNSAGISSGERKRVNIAIELAANPAVLFLDEPTTGTGPLHGEGGHASPFRPALAGIDSSSALRLLKLLRQLVHGGLPVAAVIHQPRQEVVNLVDDLILLAKGGPAERTEELLGDIPRAPHLQVAAQSSSAPWLWRCHTLRPFSATAALKTRTLPISCA